MATSDEILQLVLDILVQVQLQLDQQTIKVEKLVDTLDRFLPLLEKYENASKANSFLGARRAMKGVSQ